MQLRIFEAATLEGAQSAVREAMGPDALILATEEVASGMRITAAIEPEEDLAALLAPDQQPVDPALDPLLAYHAVPQSLQVRFRTAAQGVSLADGLARGLDGIRQAEPLGDRHLLVGPPGHGKSLAAARLAMRLVAEGRTPRVLSLGDPETPPDGRLAHWLRPSAVEVEVLDDPRALGAALAAPGPVVVDTAGVSLLSGKGVSRLRAVLAAAGDLEVALVLSVEGHPPSLLELAADFMTLGCRRLLATKLDLTARYGGLVTLAVSGLTMLPAAVSGTPCEPLVPLEAKGLARLLVHRFNARSNPRQAETP